MDRIFYIGYIGILGLGDVAAGGRWPLAFSHLLHLFCGISCEYTSASELYKLRSPFSSYGSHLRDLRDLRDLVLVCLAETRWSRRTRKIRRFLQRLPPKALSMSSAATGSKGPRALTSAVPTGVAEQGLSTSSGRVVATLLKPDADGLAQAGEKLRAGGLVSFPTETVYGLGANAFDEDAVESIFTTKGRPLTDPLIVHVPTKHEALTLLELSPNAKTIYERLANAFWPGPLTLVGKAVKRIPLLVTAGTGFVGVRCPQHQVARNLLVEARVPVAAPSANRFGHVSPTTAMHVMSDLGVHPISIINGEHDEGMTCGVGIESTVLKVDDERKKIVIFRRGGVSETEIRTALSETGYELEVLNKTVPMHGETGDEEKSKPEGQQAPGQCLTHYAPDVNTSIVVEDRYASANKPEAIRNARPCPCPLSECVVIDFGGRLEWMKGHALGYRDLSCKGDFQEAGRHLFDTLRWTEDVESVRHVLLVDITAPGGTCINSTSKEHAAAVADRLFRAASGKYSRVASFSINSAGAEAEQSA